MVDRVKSTGGDDPFLNFSCNPPKPVGRFRAFTHASRCKPSSCLTSSREQLGSMTSLSASLTGSTHNLLDPMKLMSMQESARMHTISSEVMKHSLYESVISPGKRRYSACLKRRPDSCVMSSGYSDCSGDGAPDWRMVQSLPVTPNQSQNATPTQSPTSCKRFCSFLSRGPTPCGSTLLRNRSERSLEVEEDSWKGLPSLFRPSPRYIPANGSAVASSEFEDSIAHIGEKKLQLDAPPKGRRSQSDLTQ